MAVAPLLSGPGLVLRRLRVADHDVVFLRSVVEGYDGLAALHGDGSGIVSLCAPESRASELDALISDLASEVALLRL